MYARRYVSNSARRKHAGRGVDRYNIRLHPAVRRDCSVYVELRYYNYQRLPVVAGYLLLHLDHDGNSLLLLGNVSYTDADDDASAASSSAA